MNDGLTATVIIHQQQISFFVCTLLHVGLNDRPYGAVLLE
jgi:hypothetical protein